MKLQGLKFKEIKTVYNGQLVAQTKTIGLGSGEWAIEAYDDEGLLLAEFVGSNGQCFGEEPDDLWAELRSWTHEIAYTFKVFVAPDGEEGTLSYFWREARRSRLHGCLIVL